MPSEMRELFMLTKDFSNKAMFVAADYTNLIAKRGDLFIKAGIVFNPIKNKYVFRKFSVPLQVDYHFRSRWIGKNKKIARSKRHLLDSFRDIGIYHHNYTERKFLLKLQSYCFSRGIPVNNSFNFRELCKSKTSTEQFIIGLENSGYGGVIRPKTWINKPSKKIIAEAVNLNMPAIILKEDGGTGGGKSGESLKIIALDDKNAAQKTARKWVRKKKRRFLAQEFLMRPFLVDNKRVIFRIYAIPMFENDKLKSLRFIGGVARIANAEFSTDFGDLDAQVITEEYRPYPVILNKIGKSSHFHNELMDNITAVTYSLINTIACSEREFLLLGFDIMPAYDKDGYIRPYFIEVNSRPYLTWEDPKIDSYLGIYFKKYMIPSIIKIALNKRKNTRNIKWT